MFIVLEGPDGSGKTTQAELLARALSERGYDVVSTREPGGSKTLGPQLREILLHADELGDQAEALLFAAERAEHVRTVVRPALERGALVVCDRFIDSTLAYQGAGRGLAEADLLALCDFATGGLVPDLTVVCDVTPEVAEARRDARSAADRIESAQMGERVRDLLLRRAAENQERYLVVDASTSPEEVASALLAGFDEFTSRR
jgi:dTMP kinase